MRAARRRFLSSFSKEGDPAGRLPVRQWRIGQLERDGVFTPGAFYPEWDDEFHLPVRNGHERTPGAIAFDLIRIVPQFHQRQKNIVWIAGEPGRGKSHLARIMVGYYCLANDVDGHLINWSAKLEALKASFGSRQKGQPRASLTEAYQAEGLVLDDVGMEHSYWELQQLYRLIEARRTKGLTVVTSNCQLAKPYVGEDIMQDTKPVTYASFFSLLFNPGRPADQREPRYKPLAARIRDRLLTGGGDSYLLAEVRLEADQSHRGKL